MKKLLLFIALIPMVAVAQQRNTTPVKIDGGDGMNPLIKLVSTNQQAPFIAINNGTTSILTVQSNGAVSLDSISLANTNGQISFGATNTAPSVSTNANTWVKVSIYGDTNVYKLPLYR